MDNTNELLEQILEELKNISEKLGDIDEKLDDIGGEVEELSDIEGHLDDIKSHLEVKTGKVFRKSHCGPGEYRREDGTIGKFGENDTK